jgi:hypothetical protein
MRHLSRMADASAPREASWAAVVLYRFECPNPIGEVNTWLRFPRLTEESARGLAQSTTWRSGCCVGPREASWTAVVRYRFALCAIAVITEHALDKSAMHW